MLTREQSEKGGGVFNCLRGKERNFKRIQPNVSKVMVRNLYFQTCFSRMLMQQYNKEESLISSCFLEEENGFI